MVYDIFDLAVDEKWKDVVLHDCSNQVKFYRGVQSGHNHLGDIEYRNEFNGGGNTPERQLYMGIDWFIDATTRYKEIGNDFSK